MVSQLLDPRQPKNMSDLVVLAIIALHIAAAYALPTGLKRPAFRAIFLFWRTAYNLGIGYLLRVQSDHRRLVTWAKNWKLFENPKNGDNPRPWLYYLLKRELEAKIPEDYRFEDAPIEYNTWLVFRRLVDLILMCDFTSYCLFAIVCAQKPPEEGLLMALTRWGVGIALFAFNLWVKLDAHRVVKDYAWYWGDFFYLVDQELTFDGVFEMAPHPMYSVGYAGYYGISMMAASYDVLFISIGAHLAQFAFLAIVENPHIEKTYNPPPPRKRAEAAGPGERGADAVVAAVDGPATAPLNSDLPIHNLLGLKNLDLFRITDYSVILLTVYVFALALATPETVMFKTLFVIHALVWRLWYSIGLGIILRLQSNGRMWTRHFVKYGESAGEAWRQWKGMYHVSMTMCYASFIAACWKMYSLPDDWSYGMVMLKHVLGASLVALQIWTAVSIYETLGEFGWFFGDFFFDHQAKLTYGSIYRFLNNPERVLGTAGLWGAALITWSRAIFVLALVSQILTLGFIAFVEKPHMQKIYGRKLREEAGLTKFIRRSLPPPVKELQQQVDKVVDETANFVWEFVEMARPRLAAGVSTIVRDTSALFNKYPARLTISQLSPDLAGFNPKQYSLSVEGTPAMASGFPLRVLNRDADKDANDNKVISDPGRTPGANTLVLAYGAPIHVRWTAPEHHSHRDWIGLYMVADNRARDVTDVSSMGRWVPTNRGHYDATAEKGIVFSDKPVVAKADVAANDPNLVTGEVVFSGDKLWWAEGVYEFRYHHDGNHNVMAISQPFEVRIPRFADEEYDEAIDLCMSSSPRNSFSSSSLSSSTHLLSTSALGGRVATHPTAAVTSYQRAVEEALLPLVADCLDRNPDIAPSTAEEPFGAAVDRDEKYARRVVYAIRRMFAIDFAPAVVPADRCVRNLAWRICNAKQVLVSLQSHKAT